MLAHRDRLLMIAAGQGQKLLEDCIFERNPLSQALYGRTLLAFQTCTLRIEFSRPKVASSTGALAFRGWKSRTLPRHSAAGRRRPGAFPPEFKPGSTVARLFKNQIAAE